VKDGVITNMLVGSPAFLSHKFKRGDRVLKIDGEDVDESGAGLTKMLIGSDVPGTDVTVTVKREADNVFDVTLTRATTLELADKKKMFQLFAQIKDLAHQREDKGPNDSQNADDSIASSSDVGGSTARILPLVDAAVDLWTRMFEAVVTHDEMIAANVSGLMRAVDEDVCALDTNCSRCATTRDLPSRVQRLWQSIMLHPLPRAWTRRGALRCSKKACASSSSSRHR
jgi:hypothetical protein